MPVDYCPACNLFIARWTNGGRILPHAKRRVRHKCPHGVWCSQGERNWAPHSNGRSRDCAYCNAWNALGWPSDLEAQLYGLTNDQLLGLVYPGVNGDNARAAAQERGLLAISGSSLVYERTVLGVALLGQLQVLVRGLAPAQQRMLLNDAKSPEQALAAPFVTGGRKATLALLQRRRLLARAWGEKPVLTPLGSAVQAVLLRAPT